MFSELPPIADIVGRRQSQDCLKQHCGVEDVSRGRDPSSNTEPRNMRYEFTDDEQIRDKTITLNCANYGQSAGQPPCPPLSANVVR